MEPDFLPALLAALKRSIPGVAALENAVRLSGGASQETWAFDAVTESGREKLILRRSPGGLPRVIAETSTSVPLATEAAVIETARAGGARAPRVRHVLEAKDRVGEG
ncbi:MAG: phosphotransferase family protein, partial [Alphaproteobacteria bacterium]|nr:phosphotransferase family protein [Alphaproteobacteria bacterium]